MHDETVRTTLVVTAATTIATALLLWSLRAFGGASGWFAFLVVWIPMAWLGTISKFVRPRLPEAWHRLHPFERDGRVYERLGVRLVKMALRRGPLAVFNPQLHLPITPTVASIAALDQRMRDAEASHGILLGATLAVAVHAAARGWWVAAALTLLFDMLMNGYPVMLQRYNRALLHQRYNSMFTDS